jgi:hypothetical protein
MAVPTLDELYDVVKGVIVGRQPEGEFYIFEWNYLVQMARRHFRTTTPAVDSRMKKLLEEGRLAKVKVSHHGFAFLKDDSFRTHGTLYFQYASDYRKDYGYVTANRIQGMKNVWVDGYRNLFTSSTQFEQMTTHFRSLKEQADVEEKSQEEADRVRLWEVLEAERPGSRKVLDDLYSVLKGDTNLAAKVEARLWTRRGQEDLWVDITAHGLEQAVRLIDIIRAGLAAEKKP